MNKIESLVLKEPGVFQFENAVSQPLPLGFAKIHIKAIGICGTDIHAYHGNQPFFSYPRVLGHELGGQVVEVNSAQGNVDIKVGDRVSVEPYISCGICSTCKIGRTNVCENLSVLGVHEDGGMTSFINVPIAKLHVSTSLPYESLALVETLSIGSHAVSRAHLSEGDKVLVIGAGPIGLGVAQFAKLQQAQVYMADFSEQRLQFAKRQKLIDEALKVDSKIEKTALQNLCGGSLPTVIFDATGNKNSMAATFDLVAAGGKIVLVGLFQGDLSFHDPTFHRKELTLLSSRNALPVDFKSIIKAMERGAIDIDPWITHRTTLKGLPALMPTLTKSEDLVVKALVDMG